MSANSLFIKWWYFWESLPFLENSPIDPPPTFSSHKVFFHAQFCSLGIERLNMTARLKDITAFKKGQSKCHSISLTDNLSEKIKTCRNTLQKEYYDNIKNKIIKYIKTWDLNFCDYCDCCLHYVLLKLTMYKSYLPWKKID